MLIYMCLEINSFSSCTGNLSWKALKLQGLISFKRNSYNSSLFTVTFILLLYGAIYSVPTGSLEEIPVSAVAFALLCLNKFLQMYLKSWSAPWIRVFLGAMMAAAYDCSLI